MKEIEPLAFFQLRKQTPDILVIDVREEEEFEAFNIGGMLIPLSELFTHMDRIPKDHPIIFVCKRGIRSSIAIQRLEQHGDYDQLINLKGGLEAWKKHFPPPIK